jgi:hypothetical protein
MKASVWMKSQAVKKEDDEVAFWLPTKLENCLRG